MTRPTALLLAGLCIATQLPAQQQNPRPTDPPPAQATQDLPVRAGQPVGAGTRQPIRVPDEDRAASADRPFASWTVVLPYRRGVTIWARNPSADTVVLTRIVLSDCVNLATSCGSTELNLRLGQGDSAEAITLRPKIWDDRYSYKVSWEWMSPADLRPTEPGAGAGSPLPFTVWAQTSAERREVAVMARNASPDTIVISRVRLSDCENVGIKCGDVPLNLRLAPGDSAVTLRLRPDRWGETLGFHLDWEWTRPTAGR